MRRILISFISIILTLILCSCDVLKWKAAVLDNPKENELKAASKIVFTNNKETTLNITVSDPKVIEHIASIISKGKLVSLSPNIKSDYTIKFYLQEGKQKIFNYWMGALENNKEVNFEDDSGSFYKISESLDIYVLSSTKMLDRPSSFVKLYTTAISYCIGLLEKDRSGITVVAADMTSDRRMRRYTKSYEDEKLFAGIYADSYTIVPWKENGNYTYVVTYVTNRYNTDKATITVEVVRTKDQTKQTFTLDAKLKSDGVWEIKIADK